MAGNPDSCLALVLLYDQIPRNIFRNTPRAYATDALARAAARHAIIRGFDQKVSARRRVFFYLPLEHSEHLADQRESVALQQRLAEEDPDCAIYLEYAKEHLATIERFGRFPQRNPILGRTSTPDELAFLNKE